MVEPVLKAVFPVAGRGTRFLPATKALPKEMLAVVDKPLIQYAVEEAREAGIEDFIFVTGEGEGLFKSHFGPAPGLERALKERGEDSALASILDCRIDEKHMHFVTQSRPLGLGHAVGCARDLVGGAPFAVLLPDDIILARPGGLKQMMDAYGKTGGNLIALEDVPRELTARYGVMDVEEDLDSMVRARGLVEKPKPEDAPSTLAVIGRYILQPRVFEHLAKGVKGAGGEIQLTDAIAATIGDIPLHGVRFDKRYDCGSRLGFIEANIALALDRDDMRESVRRMLEAYP
jgi:UTP--glucose-1-phosphate uridylyltransferase